MIKLDISKTLHGSNGIIDLRVKLEIKNKDFIVLTGPSGSGKTTLLRIIAGLENSDSYIKVNNNIWQDKSYTLELQKRNIGFVFQNYALFTNMNVEQNLLFIQNDKKLANRLLNITQLQELRYKFPNTLSGGQQQRVALCRAMMNRPKLLLLDEPFSALDFNIKIKLQDQIKILHKEFQTTTIMVSHDTNEAYTMGNRLIALRYGKIISNVNTKNIPKKGHIIKILDNATAIVEFNNDLIQIDISNLKL